MYVIGILLLAALLYFLHVPLIWVQFVVFLGFLTLKTLAPTLLHRTVPTLLLLGVLVHFTVMMVKFASEAFRYGMYSVDSSPLFEVLMVVIPQVFLNSIFNRPGSPPREVSKTD